MINHGIPEHVTEGALEITKNFFSLPTEAKMEVGAQSFVTVASESIRHPFDVD